MKQTASQTCHWDMGEVMKAQIEILKHVALGKPLLDIVNLIVNQSNQLFDELRCSIFLLDHEKNKFVNQVSTGIEECWVKLLMEPYSSSTQPIIIKDISIDSLLNDECKLAFQVMGMKSCWLFPILSTEGEIIGIYFLHFEEAVEPDLEALDIINTFVNLTALAVERKKADRKIYKLAYRDSLTGLFNRRHFVEKISKRLLDAIKVNEKLGLLFMDLDRFKWINDSLGHEYGDRVLIEVARRLKQFVEPNCLLSRIGGDEFILLLRYPGENEFKARVADIMAAFEEPFQLEEHEIQIVPSIGISLFPEHGITSKELLKKADTAMYQSKYEGRNEYKIYQTSYDQGKENRLFMKLELEKALSKNQFVLHYQPIINLRKDAVDSVEALIRWNHPLKGMIYPNDFIPLAEESGFITSLGDWVLREACRQNKAWQDMGLRPICVSVNVSAKQFHELAFVDKLTQILAATQLEAKWVELEITESVLMIDETRMIATLQQLKDLGVHTSIDDFGTGYSSLNYLKSLQVNAMKVDRSFIRYIPEINDDAVITKMIIQLAHALNLEVIGEGVETQCQHEFLLQNECERAQGYYYYRPLEAQQIERILVI